MIVVGKVQRLPTWWQLPFATAMSFGRLLFPQCRLCGLMPAISSHLNNQHWFDKQQFLCQSCHENIIWQNTQFNLTINQQIITGLASVSYAYPYRIIIQQFKNQHQMHQLPLLIHAIRQLDKPKGCHSHNSMIIPIPTTTLRLKKRGFDPVFLLAQYLSFHWQIPLFTQLSREERQKQQELNREQRLKNMTNAFHFSELPPTKNVIFFDDVVTTGATLQAIIEDLQRVSQLSQKKYTIYVRALAHTK